MGRMHSPKCFERCPKAAVAPLLLFSCLTVMHASSSLAAPPPSPLQDAEQRRFEELRRSVAKLGVGDEAAELIRRSYEGVSMAVWFSWNLLHQGEPVARL